MKLLIGGLIVFYSWSLVAADVTFDFSDDSRIESSSLVVNTALGVLHSTLVVKNYNNPNEFDMPVGDGRHGPFNATTYQNFSVNGDVTGNRILIDVDEYPILQVTDFDLQQGWRIEVAGDGPLIIYSLKDVKIAGEIWCHGEDGTNAVGATPGMGGIGRCGGGNGGDGGAPSQDGTDGENTDALVTGGQAGNFTGGAAVSGGGGGSWNTSSPSGPGTNASGAGGTQGTSTMDAEFTTIAGGAGGGGGSGTATDAGAGGGGGGGTVIIHAVGDFYLGALPSSNFGRILASGGAGGDSNVLGGAGGGGGGGSVRVFVGGDMEMLNTVGSGAGVAQPGLGGTNSNTDNGGNGGPGRNWYSSTIGGYNTILGGGGGYYTPGEQGIAPGDVQFTTVTQTTETISLDLQNTKPVINSVTLSPASADFSFEVKGSEDDFLNDDTGWTTDLSQLMGKRYIKARFSITNSSASNPAMIDSVSINFTPGIKNQYDFAATSCGRVETPQSPTGLLLLLMPLLLIFSLRPRRV